MMLTRLLLVVAIVAVVAVVGALVRRRDGVLRADDGHRFSPDQLEAVGLRPGSAPHLALLLGSPTCAPCVTVRRLLTDLGHHRPDFRWTYVDAADHLELTETHRVLRVPTLFVLDGDGRIVARTSGVPERGELERVLDHTRASVV